MSDRLIKLSLPVSGMSCAACLGRVERALWGTAGVSGANVNFATGRATVDYDPDRVGPGDLVEAIKCAGYGVETSKTSLKVSGMSCAACVGRVEKALSGVQGVSGVVVNLVAEKAFVEHVPGSWRSGIWNGPSREPGTGPLRKKRKGLRKTSGRGSTRGSGARSCSRRF